MSHFAHPRNARVLGPAAISFATLAGAPVAGAQERPRSPHETALRAENARRPPWELEVDGYGDLQFALFDFGPNRNRTGGAQRDTRLVFDTARLTIALEGKMPFGIELEAEVEFEHGGTGAAQELEYEEFGEFEQEVEKGGEVLIEELSVAKTFARRYSVAAGRFYVATGLLSRYHRPTDYLATTRSEAETAMVPAVWDEMGVQVAAELPVVRLTAQIVNGLDSTGFSSQHWVASGHQSRFELVRATDLAFVGRVDAEVAPGLEAGVSGYYGGTSRNRPKPDLVRACSGGNPDEVAPCGYVPAPVAIVDAHAVAHVGALRASAMAMFGHLWNAGAVSKRNDRLSNALQVPRSPVADEAIALWWELGVDVAPWLGVLPEHRLEPFVRVDHYDTMAGVRDDLHDNPRFERTLYTAGLSYTLADAFFLKLDASHRRFGSSAFTTENTVRLGTGFVY